MYTISLEVVGAAKNLRDFPRKNIPVFSHSLRKPHQNTTPWLDQSSTTQSPPLFCPLCTCHPCFDALPRPYAPPRRPAGWGEALAALPSCSGRQAFPTETRASLVPGQPASRLPGLPVMRVPATPAGPPEEERGGVRLPGPRGRGGMLRG